MPEIPPDLARPVERRSELPVGVQLAGRLRAAVSGGALAPGERAPSIRQLADAAGVNPNTVRAVYQRLEDEGLLRSEQGRGTFVAGPVTSERATRRQLQQEIARLETELVRRPPLPAEAEVPPSQSPGRLLTTGELTAVRDALLDRLEQVDATRAELIRRLGEIEAAAHIPAPAPAAPPRRSSSSLGNARVRWLGAS